MQIIFEHHLDAQGNVFAIQFIETTDPAVQTLLTNLKSNVAAQVAAGYGVVTKLTAYPGQTRWQAILGEVVRLNDTVARPLLGV